MAEVSAVGMTSVGRVRVLNEDAWYAGQWLFVVADGMGGHAAGDVASAMAITQLARRDDAGINGAQVTDALVEANAAVLEHSLANPASTGLGTTVCGLARTAEGWIVFNVGDSRCYVLTKGTLRQVTVDHSEVQEFVDAGVITRDQARVHPDRNVITRAVGQLRPPLVDLFEVPAGEGARFLLASDGLHSEVDDQVIATICAETTDRAELAAALIRAAESAGGNDNITVIVVDDLSTAEPDVGDDAVARRVSTTVPRELIVREVAP